MSKTDLLETPPPLPPLPPVPPPPPPLPRKSKWNAPLKVASLPAIISTFPATLVFLVLAIFAFGTYAGLDASHAGAKWVLDIGLVSLFGTVGLLALGNLDDNRTLTAFKQPSTESIAIVTLVSIGYIVLLWLCNEGEQITRSIVASIVLCCAIITFSPRKSTNRLWGWNRAWYVILAAIQSLLVTGIVCSALGCCMVFVLIFLSSSGDSILSSSLTIASIIAFSYVFLGRLALYQNATREERKELCKGSQILFYIGRYALLPILGVGICVVITFFFTLLATLTLPFDEVGRIGILCATAVLIALFCLYPCRYQLPRTLRPVVYKAIPVVTLFLMVIMLITVLIEIVSDGITVSAIYQLLFALISIGVFGSLLCGRLKRASTAPLLYILSFWALNAVPYFNVGYFFNERNETDSEEVHSEVVKEEEEIINTVRIWSDNSISAPEIPAEDEDGNTANSQTSAAPVAQYPESEIIQLTADAATGADIPSGAQRVRYFRLMPTEYVDAGKPLKVTYQGFSASLPIDSLAKLDPSARFKPIAVECENSKGSYIVLTYLAIEPATSENIALAYRIKEAEGFLFTRKKYRR